MSVNIEMPKLSDTMTEGTVVKWHKAVGDEIEIGDILADIETDKATMEMEAFDDGSITDILVQEGEKAPIGATLAVIDGDGNAASSSDNESTTEAPSSDEESSSDKDESSEEESSDKEEAASEDTSAPPAPTSEGGDRIKASPLARKVAAEKGVDLSGLKGSGPAGRIVRKDVDAASSGSTKSNDANAADALTKSIKSKAKQSTPAQAQAEAIQPVSSDADEKIQLSGMRKVIASRLLISKTTIPHFYLHVDVDAAPLMSLRKQINAQAEKTHGNKYSVNDFVLKAVINAAQLVPNINASFGGDHIVKFANVGLSVAIAVEDGLVTPVIKEAQNKSLLQISKSVKDFAQRAKDKKLQPNEFDNGTITVSNLGAWGIESFDAIVNPPQAAILSVGAAIEKPVVKDGEIVPGLRMNLGLSCDHRVVDGAIGAEFLNEVRKLIEQPALMLL